jgi:uncharacterized membrane protein YhaH (DUF805 family)
MLSQPGDGESSIQKGAIMDAYLNAWRQYAVFTGRSPRKEFWVFYLVNTLVIIAFSLYAGGTLIHPVLGIRIEAVGVIAVLFGLAVFIPTLAVIVRRLHDTGKSGWWILLGFVPMVGSIILLILLAFDSEPTSNQYGPHPYSP